MYLHSLPEMEPDLGSPLSFNLNDLVNPVVGLLNIQLSPDYLSELMPFYADLYAHKTSVIFYLKSLRSSSSPPSKTRLPHLNHIELLIPFRI